MVEKIKPFHFDGDIEASKSIMNRALVIQSYMPQLKINGSSNSDDVRLMRQGLQDLLAGQTVDCGHAGTVLRFLALRAAKLKGRFKLTGSQRLMSRLPDSLLQVLGQLGSEARIENGNLLIESDGWRLRGDGLWIPSGESSQFASGVLLNAWELKSPLHFVRTSQRASDSYFQMTLEMVKAFGMKVEASGLEYTVSALQKPKGTEFTVDCDISSAFVVAALGAIAGRAQVRNFPKTSLQPDISFVRFFVEMGIQIQQTGEGLNVEKSVDFSGLQADLRNCPDLFPVLAVVCAFAKTESHLSGLDALEFKESDRLKNTVVLLENLGAKVRQRGEASIQIEPCEGVHNRFIKVDTDHDHRMAMAAAVAKAKGFDIEILHPEVVNKSFPGFWSLFSC